jgi:hypothetical protein
MTENGNYFVISVMGPYAGESEKSIFIRKMKEIEANGYTLWHHQSYQAKPNMVQELGKSAKGSPIKLILTSTGSRKRGEDTKKHTQAKRYSVEKGGTLSPIPAPIYVEIGTRPWALVIKNLELVNQRINLWDYSDYFTKGAFISKQGGSTICAIKQSSREDPKKMKSNVRDIVAIADVIEPFSVWLSK